MSLRNWNRRSLNLDHNPMLDRTVTILMAVYNGQRYLRQAIESILAQTFADFELVIINDGSTDSSRRIALDFSDPRIRLVDNECNMGLSRSLNKGLSLSVGRFIARHDADDVSEPNRLARQVQFLEENKEVALLGTWYSDIDAAGNIVRMNQLPCDSTDIRWSLLFFCPFVHSAVMFRKCVVPAKVGFYNEELVYSLDYELWCRIARQMPVANLDKHLMRLRTHPWSMTATYGDKILEGHRMRIANLAALLGWDKTEVALNAERFTRTSSLVFGSHNLEPENVKELMQLHNAFCRHFEISKEDCRIHLEKLTSQISCRCTC
jgi:glycosyltransferase involved in cell wall biosynthesis